MKAMLTMLKIKWGRPPKVAKMVPSTASEKKHGRCWQKKVVLLVGIVEPNIGESFMIAEYGFSSKIATPLTMLILREESGRKKT